MNTMLGSIAVGLFVLARAEPVVAAPDEAPPLQRADGLPPATPVPPPPSPDPVIDPSPAPSATASTSTASTHALPLADEPDPAPIPDEPDEEPHPPDHPRLVLALGPMVGPHAIGNERCESEQARCETKGSVFGAGGSLEVRARVYRPLYVHLRGFAVRNVSPNDPVFDGLAGGAIGLGVYARRIFGRAEYLLVDTFGDDRFEPPFFEGEVGQVQWSRHAGMLAVGFRQPLPQGLAAELWAGPMFGPRSVRTIPQTEPDERLLVTFMLGVNLAWDAWK